MCAHVCVCVYVLVHGMLQVQLHRCETVRVVSERQAERCGQESNGMSQPWISPVCADLQSELCFVL